jgi:hypothetical protein
MKSTKEFYSEFETILKNENSPLLNDFRNISILQTPKEVFFWLNERSKNNELPEILELIITDFYYSLR